MPTRQRTVVSDQAQAWTCLLDMNLGTVSSFVLVKYSHQSTSELPVTQLEHILELQF